MNRPSRRHAVLLHAAFLSLSLAACTPNPRVAESPPSAGLTAEGARAISAAFQARVDNKEIPGAVVLVARHGRPVYFEAFGYRGREAQVPMTRDSIFRIGSMTKPIAAVAVMMLVEEGRLSLSDPLSRHLPEFANLQVGVEKPDAAGKMQLVLEPARQGPTILDLLRHTSGITYAFTGKTLVKERYGAAAAMDPLQTNAQMASKLARLPLQHQPGTTWDYSMSTDVLGRVVEVASGMELERFLEARIFKPLGMRDTAFWMEDPARQARMAQAQVDPATGQRPPMPDKTRRMWASAGGGLVSTVGDYWRFCEMLRNGGELEGVRIVSRRTVELMAKNHLSPDIQVNYLGNPIVDTRPQSPQGYGLGMAVRVRQEGAEFPGSVGDFSWTGIYGTQFWVDPAKQLVVIVMYQVPTSAGALRGRYALQMRKLVYDALEN